MIITNIRQGIDKEAKEYKTFELKVFHPEVFVQ